MAPKLLFSLVLTLFLHGAAASLCNVTCSTDYIKKLNCFCSDSVPTLPVLLNITCSDGEVDSRGSCVIEPHQSQCKILMEDLEEVTTIGTNCTATVGHLGSKEPVVGSESFIWALSDVVKPEAPVDVKVTNAGESYNITWSNTSPDHKLVYRVRIRTAADTKKVEEYVFPVVEEHILINHKSLQPDVVYMVDVQAQMGPGFYLKGPGSEWSSVAEWRTAACSDDEKFRINVTWLYVSMPILLVLALLLLGYLQKPCWQKKLRMITYIPRPNDYFKPLYHSYEGNFKEWVKPVFAEFDYLTINANMTMGEKQNSFLHWNNEKQSYSEEEIKEGGLFLHIPRASDNLLQDSSSSQSTGHSTGHISIHTVTLSGGEFEEEVTSQSSLRSYQDGESFGLFADADRDNAGYDLEDSPVSRRNRQSGISLQRENQIANDLLMENLNYEANAEFNEAERVSLVSFESNEQSEDGYPRVDLDTIDSGYGECSSPGASDSNRAQQMDSFHQHKNSNYVKQWMICSTIQEDPRNVNNELNETQEL